MVISLALLASTMVSACGHKKQNLEADSDQPSSYAKGNYPGTLKIGKPYDIDGRTYVPAHDPDYTEEGMASWYGPGFHGRSTANGERFDQHALTAAHRTLPMPSMVKVTNLENGEVAMLKVNDRGPFKKDRIIDLSKASAEKLGVIGKGTALVRVEYLPAETKLLIADLIKNNQLQATQDTLNMLAMNNLLDEQDVENAIPQPSGYSLVSSANAAEPVSPVPQFLQNNAVSERAPLPAVASRDLATSPETRMAGLQEQTSGDGPLYQPIEAPATPPMQTPQVPAYERETVVASTTDPSIPAGIFIQAGSFSQAQNAHDLSQRLTPVGRTVVKPVEINGRTWYRVQVGPLTSMSTAHSAMQDLEGMGIHNARVVRD
jgi:rare lipoprotein A